MTFANGPAARRVLAVDAAANAALGRPLLLAPDPAARVLGLPAADGLYPRVLGGAFTGIAAALAVERQRRSGGGLVGLGTAGAVAINTLGGGAVAAWLAPPGAAGLPRRGRLLLRAVAGTVLAIGAIEAWGEWRGSDRRSP